MDNLWVMKIPDNKHYTVNYRKPISEKDFEELKMHLSTPLKERGKRFRYYELPVMGYNTPTLASFGQFQPGSAGQRQRDIVALPCMFGTPATKTWVKNIYIRMEDLVMINHHIHEVVEYQIKWKSKKGKISSSKFIWDYRRIVQEANSRLTNLRNFIELETNREGYIQESYTRKLKKLGK